MTIPEAAQLVIQASSMGKNGEVFVLDMGDPVKIYDLAKQMIHLTGLTIKDEKNPNGDIQINFTGLRPGEKLYEELLIGDNATGTQHPRIMRADEDSLPLDKIMEILEQLEDSIQKYEIESILITLSKYVAGYTGNNELKDYLSLKKRTESMRDNIVDDKKIVKLSSDHIRKETP